ncbi:MAG: large subunit ribosomal protein [Actinomycetota bacterium]|nr:large subunit ribosomal protein [Actinomycetota bacterium]
MYAIIRAGGKQHKVAKGDVIEVERVKDESGSLEFVPLLVVDDKGKARSGKSDLADARVTATVLGETKGPKVEVVKYRNKTGYRRNTGHRQKYTSIQISDIKLTAGKSSSKATDSKTDTATSTDKTEEE